MGKKILALCCVNIHDGWVGGGCGWGGVGGGDLTMLKTIEFISFVRIYSAGIVCVYFPPSPNVIYKVLYFFSQSDIEITENIVKRA